MNLGNYLWEIEQTSNLANIIKDARLKNNGCKYKYSQAGKIKDIKDAK